MKPQIERIKELITLDDETVEWVSDVADILHTTPAILIASLLHDIARDDIEAHIEEHRGDRRRLQ